MPRKLNFTKDQELEISNLYKGGLSSVDLGRKYKMAPATVFRILRDCGCIPRSQSESSTLRSSMKPADQYSGRSGVFWSEKSRRWYPTASTYEYIRMDQLDRDPLVKTFNRCPDRIPYEFNGTRHHYAPDITIFYFDGSVVVEEIKPRGLANRQITIVKAAAAVAYFSAVNAKYRIVTEDQIGDDKIRNFDWIGIEKANADHIAAARKIEMRARQSEWARNKRATTPITPEERKKHAARENARYHAWKAVATPEQLAERREKLAGYTRKSRSMKNISQI